MTEEQIPRSVIGFAFIPSIEVPTHITRTLDGKDREETIFTTDIGCAINDEGGAFILQSIWGAPHGLILGSLGATNYIWLRIAPVPGSREATPLRDASKAVVAFDGSLGGGWPIDATKFDGAGYHGESQYVGMAVDDEGAAFWLWRKAVFRHEPERAELTYQWIAVDPIPGSPAEGRIHAGGKPVG